MSDDYKMKVDKDDFLVGFTTVQYIGWEICKEFTEQGQPIELKNKDDIKNGDHIFFAGFTGYHDATVEEDEYGTFVAWTLNRSLLTPLEFCKDERQCWTSGCIINSNCLDLPDWFQEKDGKNV